jgi:predicted ATPase/DNA-binding SARP family transcriptional activator
VEFGILGPLEVIDDGERVRLAGPKQRALLASLLLHPNETLSRDQLIDRIWGEAAPPSAAHRLEEHVSRLRRTLHRDGQCLVVTRPTGYALEIQDGGLDASRFADLSRRGDEALGDGDAETAAGLFRDALALWRGSPLGGVRTDVVAWPEIHELEELRAATQEKLFDAELVRARHEEIVRELKALVREEPLHERFRFQLMLALYRCGRQAESLQVYRDGRRMLIDAIGIEPGRALKELEQAILRQDPSLEQLDFGTWRQPRPPLAGNLPRPATTLVGREREITELLGLVADGARLVTLTGAGGSGKTRLALESADRLARNFPDGVFWAPLSAVRDPELVVNSLAQVVGATGALAAHIADRRVLLVVDNFEHLVEAGPELGTLVGRCRNLHLLVTSRELLHLSGETEYPVLPLADTEAVELFCGRARVQENDAVGELCRRLDNLPLAIEFAAARASVLSPREMLERLAGRLDFLEADRDAETRQRTLRATIEWSYDLLTEQEQQLFTRLAVFPGGWTLGAAADVAGGDIVTLQSLVEKSLVCHEGERFSMLETIREFALDELERNGGAEEARERHLNYFLRLSDRLGPGLWSRTAASSNAELLTELDNLRATLEYARDGPGDAAFLRIASVLAGFWIENGLDEEGRAWMEAALARRNAPPPERLRLFHGLTVLAELRRDHEHTRRYAEEMLALATELDDPDGVFFALLNLGLASEAAEDLEESEAFFRRAAAVARKAGSERQLAFVDTNIGSRNLMARSYRRAFTFSDRAARAWRGLENPILEVICLTNAGLAAIELGRLAVAGKQLETAIGLAARLRVRVLHQLGAISALDVARGNLERAAHLTGACQALCEEGFVFEPFELFVHDRTVSQLEEALVPEALEKALSEGRAMDSNDAVTLAVEAASEAALRDI